MIDTLDRVTQDYAKAEPKCHRYYIPYIYQKKMPQLGSIDYYQFLELLKFYESLGKFDPIELCNFINEVNR